jgi:hypothetical protein
MRIVRAFSVRQPFADLIMVGKKKIEYRSIPTRIRERVYVYASKNPVPAGEWKRSGHDAGSLPTGVLVGSVEITGCEYMAGEYQWKLARPIRFKRLVKPKNHPQPIWFHPF